MGLSEEIYDSSMFVLHLSVTKGSLEMLPKENILKTKSMKSCYSVAQPLVLTGLISLLPHC